MKSLRRITIIFLLIFLWVLVSLHTRILVLGIIIVLLSLEEIIRDKIALKKRWIALFTFVAYVGFFPKRTFDKLLYSSSTK